MSKSSSESVKKLLARSLAMSRNEEALKARVQEGRCIIEGCDGALSSRGLCDHHRQKWYRMYRSLSYRKRKEFEDNSKLMGLILESGEQEKWRDEKSNPFSKAVG